MGHQKYRKLKRRKHRKIMKNTIIVTVLSILFLVTGYSAFSTNIILSTRGNIVCKAKGVASLKESIVTSGDGLYLDSTEENRYIYRGKNPNNYILLGSDLFRIVAIESDETLKVRKLKASFSSAFDNGISAGINNIRYSDASTSYCYLYSSDRYFGCNVWGSRFTMRDTNENIITQMPSKTNGTSMYDLPSTEATVNINLNRWYESLSQSIKNIVSENHTFYVGHVELNDSQTLSADTLQEKKYKWKGNAGLINISDYVKASINSNCTSVYEYSNNSECYKNSESTNWMYNYAVQPSITPVSGSIITVYTIEGNPGKISIRNADNGPSTLPVLFLNSNIKICGKGTEQNPYTLSQN